MFGEAMAIDLWDTGVKVTNVYPGLVDTELIHAPGNDPIPPAIEAIPVSEFVEGVFDGLAGDALEIYVPSFFKDLASGKARDTAAFLAGAADFVRKQQEQ